MLKRIIYSIVAVFFGCMISANALFAAHVELNKARKVAENWLHHQVYIFWDWIDVDSNYPSIEDVEPVYYHGQLIAYNFLVNPRGHILIPARDELPAVKLYSASTTQRFNQSEDLPLFLEAVLEELFEVAEFEKALSFASETGEFDYDALDYSENTRLWSLFEASTQDFVHAVQESSLSAASTLTINPLVSTAWGQGVPYNLQTPKWYNGKRTMVGCLATAASQIMKYHEWPNTGSGSTKYKWWNGEKYINLSRNFSNSSYGWAHMADKLTSGNKSVQKSAVSKLSADVGIAFKMNFGPNVSTASTSNITNVLPKHFGYKKNIRWVERRKYKSDSNWMKVFRNEVQNNRPAILSIAEDNNGTRKNGHAVVVSGYRQTPIEQIHINMGWNGNYDGWYSSNNIRTGPYYFNWFNQEAGIGIEPIAASKWGENFRKTPSNWRQDSGVWKIVSNEYWQSSGRGFNQFNVSSYKGNYSNVDFSARLRRTGSDYYANNIIVRAGGPIINTTMNNGLPQNLYLFQYTTKGTYSVWKIVNGRSTALKYWAASPHIKKGANWNTLRVVAKGTTLTLYINGKRIWNGKDADLKSGRAGVGFSAPSSSNAEKLQVDWARLKAL